MNERSKKDVVVKRRATSGHLGARKETDYDKLSISDFLDEKLEVRHEDEGAKTARAKMPNVRNVRTSLTRFNQDLDLNSERRLDKALEKNELADKDDDLLLFDAEPLVATKKAQKDSKLKRLREENKSLKQ